MKKIIFLLLVIISGFNFAQSGEEQCIIGKTAHFNRLQKFADFDYPGDQKYDVKYYKLDLTVNHTAQTISGNVTCISQINEAGVTEIYYDLTDPLIVDSVFFNGNSTTFTRGSNKLNIALNGTFNQGDEITTIVYYHGTPGSSGFGSFEFSSQGGNPAIWTLSEPYGAKDWWPAKDTPADKADSADFWITVSISLIPASNGKLMEITDNGNGTHTYKWKSSYPIAQYLLSMAITNYAEYTNYYNYSPTDSMPINHFLYPGSLNSNISQLDKTPGMIEVYAEHFGDYPFINEKYGHAQFGWGGGMEHQTITSMGGFGDMLIAHELAHMWFGDKITCKDWHHIWLNEGFATYGECVMNEAWYGKAGYDSYIANKIANAKNAVGSIWVQDISSVNQIFNSNRTYSKGSVVLHMLRGIVGDSVFFNILRTYAADPNVAYGVAVTEDFQAVAESVSGMNLNYFFQEWIYGENYPRYSVVWGKQNISGNLYNLSLKINQNVNSNPTFFTMPVQVKVNFENSDTLITVFNNAQNQDFNISVNGMPTSISFDPGNWILKNLNSIVTGVEPEINPNTYSLEQNYPNPFNPNTTIKFNLANEGFTSLKIYNVLGKEVAAIVNGELTAGTHSVSFDASNLPSGIYMYTLTSGRFTETMKMLMIK
ncbi:MAG: T9SS type A sorting domain-containing protein [Ignavibacteriales bacterium]|nr:T9SS type A sorting domain-containing protein [Ignavibacteriales bacterium]